MKYQPYYQLPDESPRRDQSQVTIMGLILGFIFGITFLIMLDLIVRLILMDS